VPASDNNGIEGGVKFCYDLRLRAYSNTYMGEDSVLAFLANIQCNCLLLTGETGMPLTGSFDERKAAVGSKLQHVHLPGSHHLHLDVESFEAVRSSVVKFLREQHQQQQQLQQQQQQQPFALSSKM
jgi:hypothetical protein